MNITQENTDKLNAILNMKVEQVDYEEKVTEVLKDYRRKAQVDGFRPGKVPMGIIKKMYYTPVLVDEVNKLVSESLFNYLKENDVKEKDCRDHHKYTLDSIGTDHGNKAAYRCVEHDDDKHDQNRDRIGHVEKYLQEVANAFENRRHIKKTCK